MAYNWILETNTYAWESYAGSPHFSEGDRRQDFDNGWDEAIHLLLSPVAAAAGVHADQALDRVTHMRLALETLARSPLEYIGTMSSEDIQRIAEEGLTGHDTRARSA